MVTTKSLPTKPLMKPVMPLNAPQNNSKVLEQKNRELESEIANLRYETMLNNKEFYRKELLRAIYSVEKAIRDHANALGPMLEGLNQSETPQVEQPEEMQEAQEEKPQYEEEVEEDGII